MVLPPAVLISPNCLHELILAVNDLAVGLFRPYFLAASLYETAFKLKEDMVLTNSKHASQFTIGYNALFSAISITTFQMKYSFFVDIIIPHESVFVNSELILFVDKLFVR